MPLFGVVVGEGGSDSPDVVGNGIESFRLTDIELGFRLSEKDERLAFLDVIREDSIFHLTMIRRRWNIGELTSIGLAFIALVLGSWDLGIGELATGGDYNRFGLTGFRNLSDLSLMMALLSLIAWTGVFITMWGKYPIMRENLVYLWLGMIVVQLGSISAHSDKPDFPSSTTIGDWATLVMSNLILFFLAIVVVHRAVIETRDIHVQERHAHPDPRVVQKAWRDHSLRVWSLALGAWMIMINLMSWSGAHAIAQRPPIEDYSNLLVAIFVITGFFASVLLVHVLWYPQFMLGDAEDRIQSVRAREVSGDAPEPVQEAEQGKCPICSGSTPAARHDGGRIEVPCSESCSGSGKPGTKCPECDSALPIRIECPSCKSNTTVVSHFSRPEAW
ncbi:MAG: hypothetical protein CMA93_03940 [Euryarchaeota archaeon]|nr:hypothetical protein [Euryarchaeota archaeon]